MFDTIVLKASGIPLNEESITRHTSILSKATTYLNRDTRALHTNYVMHDEQIPYIKYADMSHTIELQLSIPKFLYGHNIALITETDIQTFFSKLQERLYELFSIKVNHLDWIVKRIDVCRNFQVDKQVSDYIRMLGKQRFAYKNTNLTNQDETVTFSNKSSSIMFYDKQKEVKDKKGSSDLVKLAKGILRLEIRPSYNDLKKYSPKRKAVELLCPSFSDEVINKALRNVKYPSEIISLDLAWLKENKEDISKIEMYLGFQTLLMMYDESTLREIYTPSTFANRKSLIKKMTIPQGNCLKPLIS
ncbi:phage/plasmid replication domain-containing protein [Paenibacillus sp. 481]|uniref:phage/plasmid replication domain-containing protein n=1 Tax=Paenibacillus sp. 481 TaxID=2835869 RepID=UPI001E2CDE89|nr:phage/plasmid replication protein [Paenibacillus sp. 481]UHA73757.1 hypothetical protein KIK04_00865 [Paenibacillus sp. 481]